MGGRWSHRLNCGLRQRWHMWLPCGGSNALATTVSVALPTRKKDIKSLRGFRQGCCWRRDLGRVNLLSDAWARRYDSAIRCSKMSKNGHFAAAKNWIVPSCSLSKLTRPCPHPWRQLENKIGWFWRWTLRLHFTLNNIVN